MLRLLRIVKPVPEAKEPLTGLTQQSLNVPTVPIDATPYVVSVARRHQNRGISLEQLVAAGKEAWQRAQRHYSAGNEQLDRWGSWWIHQGMLEALEKLLSDKEAIESGSVCP